METWQGTNVAEPLTKWCLIVICMNKKEYGLRFGRIGKTLKISNDIHKQYNSVFI